MSVERGGALPEWLLACLARPDPRAEAWKVIVSLELKLKKRVEYTMQRLASGIFAHQNWLKGNI